MQNVNAVFQEETYALIEQAYTDMRPQVRAFIFKRINDMDEAEDMTQDVFLRLLEYGQVIRPETVRNMVFTVARNLVFDYLRRQYCRQEIYDDFIYTTDCSSSYSESSIIARDLAEHELQLVHLLPPQRQRIYQMVRYDGKCVSEISAELQLSIRTVENHLLIGRRVVRESLRKCM